MVDFAAVQRAIIEGLEETEWASEVCDERWRLIWVSSQLKEILGGDERDLGVGQHLLASRNTPLWRERVQLESAAQWTRENVPLMIEHTPGGLPALVEMQLPELRELTRTLEPRTLPVWTGLGRVGSPDGTIRIRYFGLRPRSLEGEPMAAVYLYGSPLPARLLALLTRGSMKQFERMVRLVEPGRRQAAVLFADVQASVTLSRHLPSARYFALLRDLTTAVDGAVIEHGGVVGRHGGDGVTAFFLADDLGSPSRAARAALEAARALHAIARRVGEVEQEVRLNVGVHWGATLYMGQVVTGGRLEVTALGDEVNECARIQQAGREGALLASKSLIERLDPADAQALGIDPDAIAYRALAELPGAPEKVVRDAGTLAVTRLA